MVTGAQRLHNVLLGAKARLGKLFKTFRTRPISNRLSELEWAAEGKIHWVSPRDIRFVSQEYLSTDGIGPLLDKGWDALNLSLGQHDFYQRAAAVRHNGGSGSETPVAQRVLARARPGQVEQACRTGKPFDVRLDEAPENLYSQTGEARQMVHSNHDSVAVHIGRHGDLLLSHGQDWLAMANLLELPCIPVTIVARHHQWVDFKRQIVDYASRHGGVYAPLLHPDLEWIPSMHGHERFEIIRQALIAQGGTMLDIGCHWGYFCHRFEEIGFQCVGVEASPRHYPVLKKLKRAGNRNFRTVSGSIFEYVPREPGPYDVVLALSVFHHFVKSENTFHQLRELLATLQVREMYFQPHRPSDRQMWNAYWNPTEDEFVAFVLEHSVLNQAVHLGHSQDGRSLYRLTV